MSRLDESQVLLVEADADLRALLEGWLTVAGLRVRACGTAEGLLDALTATVPDVVCLNVDLPGFSAIEALGRVQKLHPGVPVLMLAAQGSLGTVVQAMHCGAHDYLTKPFERVKLVSAVTNAATLASVRADVAHLTKGLDGKGYSGVIGRSPAMRDVFRQLERVAGRDISVLIHGEGGTGKALVARAIHDNSPRASGPFVTVNCAAIAESLQESELFGQERGVAAAGGEKRHGQFVRASGGTLFLDEIAELSLGMQAKLVRVLRERSFEAVDGAKTRACDFRLLAASQRDLRKLASAGQFSQDLMLRIAVFNLELPALRQRSGDLSLLVPALLARLSESADALQVNPLAMRCLEAYAWPGNVRELESVLSGAAALARHGRIEVTDLPPTLRLQQRDTRSLLGDADDYPSGVLLTHSASLSLHDLQSNDALPLNLDELENWAIRMALTRTSGQLTEAARILGIGRTTLYRKLSKYGIRTA